MTVRKGMNVAGITSVSVVVVPDTHNPSLLNTNEVTTPAEFVIAVTSAT